MGSSGLRPHFFLVEARLHPWAVEGQMENACCFKMWELQFGDSEGKYGGETIERVL